MQGFDSDQYNRGIHIHSSNFCFKFSLAIVLYLFAYHECYHYRHVRVR